VDDERASPKARWPIKDPCGTIKPITPGPSIILMYGRRLLLNRLSSGGGLQAPADIIEVSAAAIVRLLG
jgi:hypothetical protein